MRFLTAVFAFAAAGCAMAAASVFAPQKAYTAAESESESIASAVRANPAAVAAGAAAAAELAKVALEIAKAAPDYQVPNVDREHFASSVAKHFNYAGFNVAVIHPSSNGSGAAATFSVHLKQGFSVISYKVYLGVPGTRMVVTNHGDGGFINWAYNGRVDKRDGGTVIMN